MKKVQPAGLVSTAQVGMPVQAYTFNHRRFTIRHIPGVCGTDYFGDFGIFLLPAVLSNFASRRKPLSRVFEAGFGRGVFMAVLGSLPSVRAVRGVDINPLAVELARYNLAQNGITNYQIAREDVRKTFRGNWSSDLIISMLPMIPLPSRNVLPLSVRKIVDGGKDGRKYVNFLIRNSKVHLSKGGALYLVHPDFIQGGGELTQKLMISCGLEPVLLGEKKKYLSETILTKSMRPYFEKTLGYTFRRDSHGEYFLMQAWLGIKK